MLKYFVTAQVFIIFFALWFNFWAIPSLVTSGIKAVSHSCDKVYPVEKVWNGNLFCPEKEK